MPNLLKFTRPLVCAATALLLALAAPPAVRAAPGVLVLSLGLGTYRPSLKEVREQLQQAGGGKLITLDDYRGKSLYLAVALAQESPNSGTLPTLREFSYGRYRARSASQDYLIEIEKFTGALVRPLSGNPQAKLQAYWGGGPALIRMRREGALTPRGAPALTQQDWLWSLCSFAGVVCILTSQLSLDLRYLRDFAPVSTFNGTEYQLSGQGLVYALSLHF